MMWNKLKKWWSTRAMNPAHMAELFAGLKAIQERAQSKDPALYARLSGVPIDQFWREWKAVHPEDFPQGGNTLVTDREAIRL